MERIGYIALGAGVMSALGPFVPSRRPSSHLPNNWEEYSAKLIPSIAIALLMAAGAFYEYITKPAKNRKLGYRLIGRLVVLGKQKVFGSAWLEFAPDDTHRVGIDTELFDCFEKGDTVEVIYSTTEDLISVQKIIRSAPKP